MRMNKKKKPPVTIIENPPKSWWAGDSRVEKYMGPVTDAIKRHLKWPSDEYTDIYNRAYEAVYNAIIDLEKTLRKDVLQEARMATCEYCRDVDSWRYKNVPRKHAGFWIHAPHDAKSVVETCQAGAILDLEKK